jgi:hypothetical protein
VRGADSMRTTDLCTEVSSPESSNR